MKSVYKEIESVKDRIESAFTGSNRSKVSIDRGSVDGESAEMAVALNEHILTDDPSLVARVI